MKPCYFKILKADSSLINALMEVNNIHETTGSDWRIIWVSKHVNKMAVFEGLSSLQKVNHFPASIQLTHKDKMAWNIKRKKKKFPEDYNFLPETFILPQEAKLAEAKIKSGDIWILKPFASSQGKGINLVLHPCLTCNRLMTSRKFLQIRIP